MQSSRKSSNYLFPRGTASDRSENSSDLLTSVLESVPWQTTFQSSWNSSEYIHGGSSSKSSFVRNLLAFRNNRIFYWNNKNSCLKTADCRNAELQTIATIECDIAPLFEATEIVTSPHGSCMAVVGLRGLSVLNIRTDEISGHERKVSHCIAFAERFFLNNPKIHVQQFEWFPGRETHLLLLTSDSCLRLFRLSSPSQPDLVINLHGTSNKLSLHSFTAFCVASAGDTAVQVTSLFRSPERETATVSVFALRSDGLVYTLDLTAGYERSVASSVRGPINSGVTFSADVSHFASSIAYISASLPVLVIASNGDKLVHGVLLEKDDIELDARSSGGVLASTWEFHAIEKLELTASAESVRSLPKTHHARILAKRNIPGCYVYVTEQRIFGIALPWLDDLAMLESIDTESLRPSSVRTVLSSDPFDTSSELFFLGVDLLKTETGECSLISVASNGQFSVQPLCIAPSLPMNSTLKIPDFSVNLRQKPASEAPFTEVVQSILRREMTMPSFNFKSADQLSAEDLQQILDQGMMVYTEEYLNRQSKAAQYIRDRQERLKIRRLQLVDLINEMDGKASDLTEKLHEFSNHGDYIRIELAETEFRLTTLQDNLADWNPALTTAEMQLQNNLDDLQLRIADMEELLQTVEGKLFYRDRQKEAGIASSMSTAAGSSYGLLHKQAMDQLFRIESIKRRISDLKDKMDS